MLVELQASPTPRLPAKNFPPRPASRAWRSWDPRPSDRVIAMMRLTLVHAGFPITYFTSEEKAMAWLRSRSGYATELGTALS